MTTEANVSTQEQNELMSLDGQAIPRRTARGRLPLSFAQERLWFLDQMEMEGATHNNPMAFRLRGSLHLPALERSLKEIIRRHEALRTTFTTVESQAVQIIAPSLDWDLLVIDLGDLAGSDQDAEVARLMAEEAQATFDLEYGPLFYAKLVRLGVEDHALLVNAHYAVFDHQSRAIFTQELVRLYNAFVAGEESPLPEPPIQYADFAHWQRQWLQGEALERHLAYWKAQLTGANTVLELPTDHARSAVQSIQGGVQSFTLPAALTRSLKALSQRTEASLFDLLLTAFATLIYRYTRQEDILIGSHVANRLQLETETVIGLLSNTLALRTDLSGEPTFLELLARVNQTTREARAHQGLPFEKLLDEVELKRDLSRSPLVQVVFDFQDTAAPLPELAGLSLEPIVPHSTTTIFDLALRVQEEAGALKGTVEYCVDLFEADTIARLIGHFQTLLEGIVANPEQPIFELPLLTAAERHQILVAWNDTQVDYPRDMCIHHLFEAQAKQTPDHVAVESEDQQLTYRELNARANQLAHYLRKQGVGPEVLVGIAIERSPEMIVGLLGILKAGGAYVPLDVAYPRERLDFILEDTQVPVILTQHHLLERLPGHSAQAVCIDADWGTIADEQEGNPVLEASAENLAYVIYTSGSTGRPKGVLIEHRSLVNYISDASKTFDLQPGDRGLQFASINFDASVEEIFGALVSGATLVLRTDTMLSSVEVFLRTCREWAITVLNLPTAYWHELTVALEDDDIDLPPEVRLIVIGGERALPERLAAWHRHLTRPVQLLNSYGPTEATIVATLSDLTTPGQGDSTLREVPIGFPVANTQVYLLDQYMQPMPAGMPGELHIGGDGLARGYLNQPELTAQKFIPDHFREEPGARLYKTGDLARYLPDGSLEYVGRIDHQVKIRGFRIELGEIEAALSQYPNVQQYAVIVREDTPGNRYLAAYLVAKQQPAPTHRELRGFLKERLPDYMVPAAFVIMDALPLNPSGKIDRRALPVPEITLDETFVAPRKPAEQQLAGIWAGILGLERAGIHDSFFDLGGHSLLAARLLSQIRKTFQVELPLRSVFETPTIAGLATLLERATQGEQTLLAPPIERVRRDGQLLQSFAQQRLWFLDQFAQNSVAYNIPMALHLAGPLDETALTQSLNEIVRRHEVLRTTFVMIDGQPVQRIAPALEIPLPVYDLSHHPEPQRAAEAQRLTLEEAQYPFDLAQGPLLRTALLRLDAAEHILVVTIHHIVSDGWSMNVFIKEFTALYEAFSAGEPSPLPDLPIQYADYALWQRQWLQGEMIDSQLAYWRQQLAGTPATELPTAQARPPEQTYNGATQNLMIPDSLADALHDLSRQEGVTLFMVILAAFQALLYRYTGQDDIAVGSAIANRTRSEIEDLIGFFVNMLVLRSDLSGNPTFRELVKRVRDVALGAYAHQDLPFERLVEALQPERDRSRSPLFQVLFVWEEDPIIRQEFAGLTMIAETIPNGTAKFDLSLYMQDNEGQLTGFVEYNTDLFDSDTIARMIGHFQAMLEGVVARPEQSIAELPFLTATERHQLLVEWNNTHMDYPRDICLHQLVEAQAQRTPDRIALEFQGQTITYRDLNAQANRLAHYLQKQGVGPEVMVGISTHRSPAMMIGVLGILKAGGTYVPLDPTFPRDRLAYVMENTQSSVLLTESTLLDELPEHNATTVCIDTAWEEILQEPATEPASDVTADNTAYVLYTSGSTGKPKGVQIGHRNVVNFLYSMREKPGLDEDDVLLAVTTLSFDIAVLELYLPLMVGGTVVLATREDAADGSRLARLLETSDATVMQATPSTWVILLEIGWKGNKNLRILCGGEAMPRELANQLVGRVATLWNMYGPTETTVWSSLHLVEAGKESISIGQPIANTQIYILDNHFNPTPIGVPGELYIGGDGVAKGYLNRPDLTAERFIPDPFSEDPDAYIYKTGDLATYRPNGDIEFLGRADHQIKIRGYRIEPGEIEAVLDADPRIQQSVVIVREDTPGAKRMVGYIIPDDAQQAPTVADTRALLGSQLPDYMIPSAFMIMDAFPLTPNGKVDRRALPAPDKSSLGLGESPFVAPRTPEEEKLATIWADVLGVSKVGIHDNFFNLGGHSLLAVRIFSRIDKEFGKQVPLGTLFKAPTIEQLASILQQDSMSDLWAPLVTIQGEGSKPPFFCVGGGILHMRNLSHHLGTDQPFYALQTETLEGEQLLKAQIDEIASQMVAEVRAVQPIGPYYLGGAYGSAMVTLEMARQLTREGEDVAILAAFNTLPKRTRRSFWHRVVRRIGRLLRTNPKNWAASIRDISWLHVKEYFMSVLWRVAYKFYTAIGRPMPRFLRTGTYAEMLLRRAASSYSPSETYSGAVTLFLTPEWYDSAPDDPTWGWYYLIDGVPEAHKVPGDPCTMFTEPNVYVLGQRLKASLVAAQKTTRAEG